MADVSELSQLQTLLVDGPHVSEARQLQSLLVDGPRVNVNAMPPVGWCN